MLKRLLLLLLFTAWFFSVFSQTFSVKGTVRDAENGDRLSAATLSLFPLEMHVQTNTDGTFEFRHLEPEEYQIRVQFVGFSEYSTSFILTKDTVLDIELHPATYKLNDLVVKAYTPNRSTLLETMPVQEISRAYILHNNSVNFAQMLASLPGVSSIDIGAGFSKPVIRGMAFNRIAVVDKGIVQQNQQWGADHGLEIDQYDIDYVRVHKGPLSLFYGSDAIGGVIEILPASVPKSNMVWGDVTFIAKSNNNLFGASLMTSINRDNWFVRARFTAQDYADYRIPADTITYLSWKMPIYGRRMKNTAGKEYNTSLSVNYNNGRLNSWLHASDIYGKNGFFPGSHGIPVLSRLELDISFRNIDMPYSFSNHFKLINNTTVQFADAKLMVDAGYQQNRRKEMSLFHTHYSNQKPPAVNPNEELSFWLNTYSLNARIAMGEDRRWTKIAGITSEYQHNIVRGYSFLLPAFNRFATGVFLLNNFKLNDKFSFAAGVRYDVGKIRVFGFHDSVLEEYLTMQGYADNDVRFYAQRAEELQKSFNDFSGSVGFAYTPDSQHSFKMNIGRSFRYPSANELASNGVHHGAFRHEKGDAGLDSEKGYQLDTEYEFTTQKFSLKVSPYVSYFSNFIFLNPTGEWSVLPHTGQIYRYSQSQAFMAGGELSAEYTFGNGWSASSDVEYTYSSNISDKYPLPFSPPAVVASDIKYTGNLRKMLQLYILRVENRHVFAQNRIARNEVKTPDTNWFDFSAHLHWKVKNFGFITDIQVHNIFNTPFLSHLSFYRKLNAPEPGRNIQLILKIPF